MDQSGTQAISSNGVQTIGADAIEILENDHVTIKRMLTELPDAAGARRQSLLDELKALVTIHNATEENLVYPAIHDISKRPMQANGLYKEQDEAKVIVWELSMMAPGDADFVAKAEKLRDAVFAHIQKEEDEEYPHLREAADSQQLSTLTSEVQKFRRSFTFKAGS